MPFWVGAGGAGHGAPLSPTAPPGDHHSPLCPTRARARRISYATVRCGASAPQRANGKGAGGVGDRRHRKASGQGGAHGAWGRGVGATRVGRGNLTHRKIWRLPGGFRITTTKYGPRGVDGGGKWGRVGRSGGTEGRAHDLKDHHERNRSSRELGRWARDVSRNLHSEAR